MFNELSNYVTSKIYDDIRGQFKSNKISFQMCDDTGSLEIKGNTKFSLYIVLAIFSFMGTLATRQNLLFDSA